MNPLQLKISRTAHYYLLGEPGPDIRRLVIVTHGYGQLARKFITEFKAIATKETLVVAPEGISKFYWDGFGGPPVASWMTREHRLDEIADNANYLQQLYESILIQLPKGIKITLFGFSQGVATQMRWIHAKQPLFHQLVCWAGNIPEDIDYDFLKDYFSDKELLMAYGNEDQFLNPERMEQVKGIIEEKGLNFGYFEFQGKHDIPERALLECWKRLSEK